MAPAPFSPMFSLHDIRVPEVLAPAGDAASLDAAIAAGADAVYFGLRELNARARATNFDVAELPDVVARLHRHEMKAYVALNTLVFDAEVALLDRIALTCADAGVDAVIMQDIGAVQRVRDVVPSLPIHASTQMTCTDAASATSRCRPSPRPLSGRTGGTPRPTNRGRRP